MKSRLSCKQNMDEEQQRILAEIESARGNLKGPFLAWVKSPKLAEPSQKLGAFCRYHTQLSSKLSEFAIIITAAWWRSQAEWLIHAPIAESQGISVDVIRAIQKGKVPIFESEEERLIYQLAHSLYETKRVDAVLYEQARECFGESVLVELIGILGYYSYVAMTLNCFEMLPEECEELPFKE